MTYKIIPFKKDRFIIVDNKGTVIDDAQGHGFKTKPSAHKYAYYIINKKELEERKIIAEQFIADNPKIKDYAQIFDIDNIQNEIKINPEYNPWKHFISIIKKEQKELHAKLCENLKIKNSIKRVLIESAGFI
jgi:hypothetical protein